MALRTALTAMFGSDHPVVLASMGGVADQQADRVIDAASRSHA